MWAHRSRRRILALSVTVFWLANAALVASPAASAGTDPTMLWQTWSNGSSAPVAMTVSADGSTVFVTGTSSDPVTNDDIVTTAYAASTGVLMWTNRFDGPSHGDDHPVGIGATSNGGPVFVEATSGGADSRSDLTTIALDPVDGHMVWSARIDGRSKAPDFAGDLAIAPDDATVYVVGTVRNGRAHGSDLVAAAYDAATGTRRWRVGYNGPSASKHKKPRDGGEVIVVDPSGRFVYVSGYSTFYTRDFGNTFITLALDAGSGGRIWRSRGPIYSCGEYFPQALSLTPDAGILTVTGFAADGCNESFEGFITIGYDTGTGERTWTMYDTDYSNDSFGGVAIAATGDGTEIVQTGVQISLNYDTAPDLGTIAYAPDGSVLWSDDHDGVTPTTDYSSDEAVALGILPDSSEVFVTGTNRGYTIDDNGNYNGGPRGILTIAYSATGDLLWTTRYDDPTAGGDVRPVAMVASPDGSKIFITGWGQGATGDAIVTLAYSV